MDNNAKFAALIGDLGNDAAALQRFFENPLPELKTAQIPLIEAADALGTTGTNYQLTISKHWWGVDFKMNEDLTQAIATGAIAGPALTSLITSALAVAGILTGPVAGLIAAAFATAFALKIIQIKLTDHGKGVHWPITWAQWAAAVVAAPMGPAGIVAAILVFIHPVAN
jgi:hypothetical protein